MGDGDALRGVPRGRASAADHRPSVARPTSATRPEEGLMQLASLLEEARAAAPDQRILFRDQIAPFGTKAIAAIEPWLTDQVLAAFAVRVIARVGEQGEPQAAAKALRSARTRVPETIRGDVEWALSALKLAGRQAAAPEAVPVAAKPRARSAHENPLLSPQGRRAGR
jgi:hypothetical protein